MLQLPSSTLAGAGRAGLAFLARQVARPAIRIAAVAGLAALFLPFLVLTRCG